MELLQFLADEPWYELGIRSIKGCEPCSAGEHLECATFRGVCVRVTVAECSLIAADTGAERNRVGGRAGVHWKHAHVRLKKIGALPLQVACPIIFPVGSSIAAIRVSQLRKDRRARLADVVAQK